MLKKEKVPPGKTGLTVNKKGEFVEEKLIDCNPASCPIDVLPDQLQYIIRKYDETLNFSPEYTLAALLFSSSVAIGNSYKAQLKKGFTTSAALYICAVGKAGVGKTQPFGALLSPLKEIDKKHYDDYLAELAEWKSLPPSVRSITERPGLVKTIINETTKAGLIDRHKHNKRGIGCFVDELNGFFKNIQTGTNKEMFLSAWSGDTINKDIKNESINIPDPFVSVAGTIQPEILVKVISDDTISSGFLDRVLFVYPESQQKDIWSKQDIPMSVVRLWNKVINTLMDKSHNEGEVIGFNSKASDYLFEWQKRNAKRCWQDDFYTGIGSKIETYVIRFSLIMEVLSKVLNKKPTKEISLASVKAGTALAEYFAEQALRIRAILAETKTGGLPEWKIRFYDSLPSVFPFANAKEIGASLGINEKAVQRFLINSGRFQKLEHGVYEKL